MLTKSLVIAKCSDYRGEANETCNMWLSKGSNTLFLPSGPRRQCLCEKLNFGAIARADHDSRSRRPASI